MRVALFIGGEVFFRSKPVTDCNARDAVFGLSKEPNSEHFADILVGMVQVLLLIYEGSLGVDGELHAFWSN
ncbi:MAG: hypothetical protein ABI177_12515, partial [Edaphobacter sp.]